MNGPLELMKVAPCFMKFQRIGGTLFFSQDVRQGNKFILPLGLQKINDCCCVSMARELKKWEEHKATLPLTKGELDRLKSRISQSQHFWHTLGFDTRGT